MSRQENIPRLSSTKLKKKAPDYIHLSILLKDIDEAIKSHASGDLLRERSGKSARIKEKLFAREKEVLAPAAAE